MGMLAAALMMSAAAPQSAFAPSFSCAGQLSPTEAAICKDPELAAWDKAMGRLYRLVDKEWELPPARQREWLARRDACGANRVCIRDAYRNWPGFAANVTGVGTEFHRQGTDPDDSADLEVLPIFGGWYYFSIVAMHVQNAEMGTVHDGMASGLVQITSTRGTFDPSPSEDYACRLHLERIDARHWSVEEFGERTSCGGLNVYLSGDYVRSANTGR